MFVFKHICYTSNTQKASLVELLCEEVDRGDECCDGVEDHKDCCETDVNFEKYSPEAKSEKSLLVKSNELQSLDLPIAFLYSDFSREIHEVSTSIIYPQSNPKISHPLSVQERLSLVQTYLC